MQSPIKLSAWCFVLTLTACGGGGPSGAVTPSAGASSLDELRELDGTALGTAASAIPDLEAPGPLGGALRKRTPAPAVQGLTPVDATYGFEKGVLQSILWTMKASDCKALVERLGARFGKPAEESGGSAWTGKKTELKVRVAGDSCLVSFGAAEAFRPKDPCDGPKSSAAPRFLGVEIGAGPSAVKGFRKKEANDSTVWYEPPAKTYEGITLSRLTYALESDKLQRVAFDASSDEACKGLDKKLRATYGEPTTTAPNAGGGTSLFWRGAGFELKLNDFKGKCSGIFSAGVCK